MRRLPALLIPLALLTATACVTVADNGRPVGPPAVPAAVDTSVTQRPPSQAPAREELTRTGDGKPPGRAAGHSRDHAVRRTPAASPQRTVRRVAPPGTTSPHRPRALRPAPAPPRRPAAVAPRKKRPQDSRPEATYDMRALCRSAARNGVGANIVGLCRSTYGR
ncbi:hypothetical protein ACIQ9Q_29670 [Streptomyces sp. NPDC094438]|uniref:hypothetical protein n=1 Tax=Streptomyces sp. NPDC094438 TaxID=3366061 RepID=UPI00382695E5